MSFNFILRSVGKLAIALFIGGSWQSQGVAAAVLISHGICLPLCTIWATRYVFKRLSSLQTL